MLTIEVLTEDRVSWLTDEFARLAGPKSVGYFQRCFAEQVRGERVVVVCRDGEQLHGFCHVVWAPSYGPFREQGIPIHMQRRSAQLMAARCETCLKALAQALESPA